MRISLILAHPHRGSFNHAIASTAQEELERLGHDVVLHDLCEEDFDPLITPEEFQRDAQLPKAVEIHCREIAAAEGIVLVHPNWWGQPPAILKGWVDRVLRPGVAYRFLEGDSGEGVPEGLLVAQRALVLNTANTKPERERAVFGDPLTGLWQNCVLGFCGVRDVRREVFTVVVTSTPAERAGWLERVRELVRETFPSRLPAPVAAK